MLISVGIFHDNYAFEKKKKKSGNVHNESKLQNMHLLESFDAQSLNVRYVVHLLLVPFY